jgi:xylulokinase
MLLLGLDVGTTGARAVAVDEAGRVRAAASAGYSLRTPRPGWAEQDPADWWAGTRSALARVAADAAGDGEIAGLGLTGQMHGSVFLDAADEVIRPALLWNDQRTAAQCARITELVGAQRLIELAGNPALTGFQAPKVLWLRDEEPAAYARVAHLLLPKDYVRLLLTGERATDVSDASGTLLLDVRRRVWAEPILDALGIPRAWMPEVYEGPEVTGRLSGAVADELGLPAGIPVAAGGGDNAAAAVGTGIVAAGQVSSSIGTSGVVFAHGDEFAPDPSGRVHAFCHAVPGKYHLMGVTLSAGGSLRWWRDVIGQELAYDDLCAEAAALPPGAEGLLFLPYLTGERTPHLDPEARGAFFGLTARHGRAHLTRALMEGVVFGLRDSLEIMRGLGVAPSRVVATGGGARSALWRELQADVYGVPVSRTAAEEGPAYGAALLAGVGAGAFADVHEACALIELRPERTEPDAARSRAYDRVYAHYRELYPATAALAHRLT